MKVSRYIDPIDPRTRAGDEELHEERFAAVEFHCTAKPNEWKEPLEKYSARRKELEEQFRKATFIPNRML